MQKHIIPLIKELVYLFEEDTHKPIVHRIEILGDGREVSLIVNRKSERATMVFKGLNASTQNEELSPIFILHFRRGTKDLCGITILQLSDFIADWREFGGVGSILPVLRRFAGSY